MIRELRKRFRMSDAMWQTVRGKRYLTRMVILEYWCILGRLTHKELIFREATEILRHYQRVNPIPQNPLPLPGFVPKLKPNWELL